jgi:hypothetical protein
MRFRPLPGLERGQIVHDVPPDPFLRLPYASGPPVTGSVCPRDPRRLLGGEKRHGVRDILGPAHPPHRDRLDKIVAKGGRPSPR